MIPTLGIPVLNCSDLFYRCVRSIDYPIDTLFIVDNSNGKDIGIKSICDQLEQRKLPNSSFFENVIIERGKNKGVGPSWNHVMKNSGGPWLFIGSDIAVLPGSLKSFYDTYTENQSADMIFGDGYNSFLMMHGGFEKIGYFDENFYPAYYEDMDHWYRGTLVGVVRVGVPSFKRLHGYTDDPADNSKKSNTIKFDPEIHRKNKMTSLNNHHYYIKKWGGRPHEEKFKTPFNKDLPVNFWELDKEHRKKNSLW